MATRTALPRSGGTHDTDGGVWRAADVDTLPGGLTGKATITASQTGITTTTDITGLTLTLTPNASTDLVIVYKVLVSLTSASTNDWVQIKLLKDGTQIDAASAPVPLASTNLSITGRAIDESPTNASHTYKLQLAVLNGTGTYSVVASGTNKGQLLIFEAGPTF